jgi:hypothetical protein
MENSRASVAGAGWECPSNGFEQRVPRRQRNHPLNWFSPAPLWQSRNDRLVTPSDDPTNADREAWMRHLYGATDPDLVVSVAGGEQTRFIVAGDTGEGDASQWAVVPVLERLAADHEFLFIASDVIYPAGGALEYAEKFFLPYAEFPRRIFAIPGNHDWYDALTGYMANLCDHLEVPDGVGRGPKSRLRRALWRRPPRATAAQVAAIPHRAARRALGAPQPGPYFAVDTGPLLLVGIDTGITNRVMDARQGAWLRRVSAASPKPKILITGSPLIVNGKHHPGPIEGGGTVDEIVRRAEHNYIATIGGDIHNYQRYPLRLADGRVIQYVVSGGGGAFMHATHTIGNVDHLVDEADFRCYPLRGDSLSFFSRAYAQRAAAATPGAPRPPHRSRAGGGLHGGAAGPDAHQAGGARRRRHRRDAPLGGSPADQEGAERHRLPPAPHVRVPRLEHGAAVQERALGAGDGHVDPDRLHRRDRLRGRRPARPGGHLCGHPRGRPLDVAHAGRNVAAWAGPPSAGAIPRGVSS